MRTKKVDLEKVYKVVNTFMVSSAFFNILRQQLFFPKNGVVSGDSPYEVCEVIDVEEMRRIEKLSEEAGIDVQNYLYVLKDGVAKKKVHENDDFVPFVNVVEDAFTTFAMDTRPLLFPKMWEKGFFTDIEVEQISKEYILEGLCVLQLILFSIPLSEYFEKAREPLPPTPPVPRVYAFQ